MARRELQKGDTVVRHSMPTHLGTIQRVFTKKVRGVDTKMCEVVRTTDDGNVTETWNYDDCIYAD